MAYLNCPFCPSQGIPTKVQESVLRLGMGLVRFECISKHVFYVEVEREKEKDVVSER